MRANDVEYFAPARFDDELEIHVRDRARSGGRASRTSSRRTSCRSDTLMVTAHQTLVYVDLAAREALPIPDDYKERLGVG